MSLQPLLLFGFPQGGLETDKKPFLLPDSAFPVLENAYLWRDRIKKREGLEFLGRLSRVLSSVSAGNINLIESPQLINVFYFLGLKGIITNVTQANPAQVTSPLHELPNGNMILISGVIGMPELNGNTYSITVVDENNFTINANTEATPYISGGSWVNTSEPNAVLQSMTLVIVIGAQTLTDSSGTGSLTIAPAGNITAATINYSTGVLTLKFSAPAAGQAVTITMTYFPCLPVMGIWERELAPVNDEQTVFWDTKYAYINTGSYFVEFIPGTTWAGSDSDFFSIANYRGILPSDRLFFATNFVVDAADPIRYTDQSTSAWVPFAPLVSATISLYQARILIPYYGRLVALNVYEGTTSEGYGGATNIGNRAVFSQIGNPLESMTPSPVVDLAWRRDIFGRGGFIDAPINEDIVSASFFKNTLIVQFERSTWQLRYIGEYGLPFLWERISSDFGCESTFSSIIFDQGVASVGDRAITSATSNTVNRIDEQIPDQVFDFLNINNGTKRVWGIRDFRKELAFWCYPDSQYLEPGQYFPNKTLLYNYRNNTYAIFRNNVTAFGRFQLINGINWDSLTTFWDDMDVYWDDMEDQSLFPAVVSGNQQGYVHLYGKTSIEGKSLFISAIDFTVTPVELTIPNHNIEDEEIIYLQNILVNSGTLSALNNQIYQIAFVDINNITITQWDGTEYIDVAPPIGETAYIGNGEVTLLPKMTIETKDFNPFQEQGKQIRISHIDFQTDIQPNSPGSAISVNLIVNSTPNVYGNLLVGNQEVENFVPPPLDMLPFSYVWHRFFANTFGQYIRIQITFDDTLMNQITTHQESFELNAINLWIREAGKIIF